MKVTVIDYGIGNLFSVARALERCGAEVRLSSDPEQIIAAERLVLPGVGAFEDGMRGLRDRGLVQSIRRYAAADRPLLGICLGMQMLASVSEEFGMHEGLDLIPGRVVPVQKTKTDGTAQKIPHIGWSAIQPAPGANWASTPLAGIDSGTSVYLVHSYQVAVSDSAALLAVCDYGGHAVTAAIHAGRITGCQFHPEKSGDAGLAVLRSFLVQ
jgi:imidazole glycerol-phosphate synthase subunit HisH